jgi:hypothetical protein
MCIKTSNQYKKIGVKKRGSSFSIMDEIMAFEEVMDWWHPYV